MSGRAGAFLVLGGLASWWGLFVLAWRLAARRLGVVGAPPSGAGPRERLVRRNLRAALAFDLLVMFPVGLPLLVSVALSGEPEALELVLTMLPGLVMFGLALPALARRARALRERRLAGRSEEGDPPSLWIDGPRTVLEAARGDDLVAKLAAALVVGAGVALAAGWFREGVPPQLSFVLFACGVAANEVSEGRRG
jgi:hypothetical protein